MDSPELVTLRAQVALARSWDDARTRRVSLGLLSRPPLFDVEAASACNAVCTFCPREAMARPSGVMSRETMDALLGFLPDDAVVMVAGLGEPLVNPHLEHLLRGLRGRGISACVVSNGMLLTAARLERLLEAGLDQVQVSLHGRSSETVRRIMPRGVDLARVEANLRHLAARRPPALRVRLNVVLTPDNAHELPLLRALADELGFDLFVRPEHNRGGHHQDGRDGAHAPGCGIFAAVTFVSAQGRVLACVNDVAGESELGHVAGLRWSDVLAWKVSHLDPGPGFGACGGCNDDYRWAILARGDVG